MPHLPTDGPLRAVIHADFIASGEVAPQPTHDDIYRAAFVLNERQATTVPTLQRIPVAEAMGPLIAERLLLRQSVATQDHGDDRLPWIERLPVAYNVVSGRDLWSDLPYLFLDGPDAWRIRLLVYRVLDDLRAHPAESASMLVQLQHVALRVPGSTSGEGAVYVPHPVGAASTSYRKAATGLADADTIDVDDAALASLLTAIRAADREPVLGDEGEIEASGGAEAGVLVVAERRYATVVLPSADTWRYKTLVCLEHFTAQGGRLLLVGEPPSQVDCEDNDRWQAVVARATPVDLDGLADAL